MKKYAAAASVIALLATLVGVIAYVDRRGESDERTLSVDQAQRLQGEFSKVGVSFPTDLPSPYEWFDVQSVPSGNPSSGALVLAFKNYDGDAPLLEICQPSTAVEDCSPNEGEIAREVSDGKPVFIRQVGEEPLRGELRKFWQDVDFTQDLERVTWLRR